ncbi:UDP-glucose dehydrogenase family protein [Brockia lithotrophica]|uniref:UDP-glucose dehydrogenase family protein n=1 Tax=Brockia lithotrophica TaxID=933949 RepID=UPI000EB4CAA8|nr:UDP-glucose/GDP-mannose dehydrogenase family protein [Brockia lithotrophica]
MDVAIVGMGYVGVTTAATLAHIGHRVYGLDIDVGRIELLSRGKAPFYEPHLDELLARNLERMHFTTDYGEAIPRADVVFIAVGTPSLPDGRPDLRYVEEAAREIGRHLNAERFTLVINKSTVPIGSGNWVEAHIRRSFSETHGEANGRFAVASNPEFLREGSAVSDSLYPDRIVVGADDPRAREILRKLYAPLVAQDFSPPESVPRPEHVQTVPYVETDTATAELVKYAANAFLALKISFINEIAALAEKVGADIRDVARGIGLDRRIGTSFLQAGVGWGGSCFPKDTAAILATGEEYGLKMPIVAAAREVNFAQRKKVVEKLLGELKIIKGKTIGLLGLSFKPNTDDLRDAPAYDIARELLEKGAFVRAYDPVAIPRAQREWNLDIEYRKSVLDVARGADALVLVTEWKEFTELDWTEVARVMRTPVLIDGRNALPGKVVQEAGLRYIGFGVPAHFPAYERVAELR